MDDEKKKTTWANVDPANPTAMANLDEREDEQATERVQQAVQQLKKRRILDDNGRRIRTSTPADMRDDSGTDFGG